MIPIQDKGEGKIYYCTGTTMKEDMNCPCFQMEGNKCVEKPIVEEKTYKEENRQLFEWVKASEQLPPKLFGTIARFIHTKTILYDFVEWVRSSPDKLNLVEWLKPIPQSSLKENALLKDSDEFLIKIADKMGLYVDFSDEGYDGDKEVPMDRIGFLDYLLTHASSLTPKSIRDSEATLIEEIRQIKAAIIHFDTLDKMPTLELLDRDHLIAYIVTIAQQILRDYPPKSNKYENSK